MVFGPFFMTVYALQNIFQYFTGTSGEKRCASKASAEIKKEKHCKEKQKSTRKRRLKSNQDGRILPETKRQRTTICLYDLTVVKVVGQGAFGTVSLCEERSFNNKRYAVKQMKEMADRNVTNVEKKVLSLGSCNVFLTRLCEEVENENPAYIIMDYVDGGDLLDELNRHGQWFGESRGRFYTAEIIVGLEYLHMKGVVHRDLKLENILLTKTGHIKISDFGLSYFAQMGENIDSEERCGTPHYMAPEVILRHPYDSCVDWWSLGVMVFVMLTGMMPFDGESEEDLFDYIVYEKPEEPDQETLSALSIEAIELLLHLLEKYPRDRIGYKGGDFPNIRGHAFFQGLDWSKLEALEIDPP